MSSLKYINKYKQLIEHENNKAAIEAYNAENNTDIEIRQVKFLNNMVEQDHRFIKRLTTPMLRFKKFYSASVTLRGIELVRMIRKGNIENRNNSVQTPVEIFYSLAAKFQELKYSSALLYFLRQNHLNCIGVNSFSFCFDR